MVSETGVADDAGAGDRARPHETRSGQPCRVVKVGRRDKFSRPVRFALLLGLPALLWGGIYFAIRLLD
jgi:hypothetical protein